MERKICDLICKEGKCVLAEGIYHQARDGSTRIDKRWSNKTWEGFVARTKNSVDSYGCRKPHLIKRANSESRCKIC
jgi:hypothetical protein